MSAVIMQPFEHSYVPAVLPKAIHAAPALNLWSGTQGLIRMRERAGAAAVQVMHSKDSKFYGDIMRHSPVICRSEQGRPSTSSFLYLLACGPR